MKKIIFATIVIFSMNSCYYDNREDLLGVCDPSGAKYSTTVVPLLVSKCNACHAAPAIAGGSIVLDNYADVKKSVDKGAFYGSISHDPNFSEMPKNNDKLDSCTLAKIKYWIDAGALNN